MALTIMTNETAVAAQRHLYNTDNRLNTVVQQLASGNRINKAADDPAGLAISDLMGATIRSMGQAMRNSQDAVSLIQVFEGGTTEISNMLVRLRELAMESATDTVGNTERGLIENEVTQLKAEITRIARTTVYAGRELLAGEDLKLEFQVGSNNVADRDRIVFDPGNSNLTSEGIGVDGVTLTQKESSQDALDVLDVAIHKVNELRARIGATQNRLQTTYNNQSVYFENLSAAKSRIRDTDMAVASTALARENILKQAGIAVLTQANESPRMALNLLRQ